MKSLLRLSFLSLLVCAAGAIAGSGCTSKAPKEVFHAGDEVPPDFMTGPAGMFLTNLDGFSAKAAFSVASAGGFPHTTKGDVLEREGRLIFQPAKTVKTKNALLQGGMIFIWDESEHFGYVLSDPLQAYARITTSVQGTNITWNQDGAAEEAVNGHPCRRVQAVVECDDGSSERFTVWQAEDEKRLPARIRLTSGSRPFTVDFSNIRMELPKPELFVPPDGFTKYVTSVALMNELILRQTELIKSNGPKGPMLEQGGPLIQNWRPTTTQ